MPARYRDKIEEALADKDVVKKALASGVHDALLKHKQAGNTIVAMKDGQMVWIKPEEIAV